MVLLLEIADHSKFKGFKLESIGQLVWGNAGKYFIEIFLHFSLILGFISCIIFAREYFTSLFCSDSSGPNCPNQIIVLAIMLGISLIVNLV